MANNIDFNVSTNAVTVLNQTAGAAENTAKGFTSAKAELRALNNQLLTMDQTSDAFKKASARAAELKDNISDLGAEINANAGNAFEGLSNNVGLFGSRLMSLDLKGAGQALSGMGAAVGKIDFKTVKEEVGGLIKGLADLGKAILANPIILLGAAVVASIVYFKELQTIFEDLTMNADKMNRRLLESQQVLEEIGKAKVVVENIKLLSKVVNDHTKSEEDRKKALDKLNVAFKANNIQTVSNITNTDALAKSTDNLIVKLVKEAEVRGKMAYLQELYAKKTKISAEAAQGSTNQALLILESMSKTSGSLSAQFGQGVVNLFSSTTLADMEEVNNQIKLVEENILSSSEAIAQIDLSGAIPPPPDKTKELKAAELARQKEIDDFNKSQEEIDAIFQKWDEERIAEEQKSAQLKYDLQQKELARAEEQFQQLQRLQSTAKENEINDAVLASEKLQELAVGNLDLETATQEELKAKIAEINKKYADEEQALRDKEADDIKKKDADERKLALDTANARLEIAQQGFTALSALGDAYFSSQLANVQAGSKAELDLKKKQFAFNKKMQIGGAIMDTAKAITAAIAANPFPSPTLPVSIALASITGAAQIAKIASTKFDGGGGGGGGGVNIPTTGGDGTTAPSPANYDFISQQPNQQPPLQAYVVGTQVSSNLEAQQLIQNQSRLGG